MEMNIFRMENSCRKKMRKNLKRREKVQVLILILSGLDNFYKSVYLSVCMSQSQGISVSRSIDSLILYWSYWCLISFFRIEFQSGKYFQDQFQVYWRFGRQLPQQQVVKLLQQHFLQLLQQQILPPINKRNYQVYIFSSTNKKSFALELR